MQNIIDSRRLQRVPLVERCIAHHPVMSIIHSLCSIVDSILGNIKETREKRKNAGSRTYVYYATGVK
jgi:hypothetical protein